MVRAGRRGFSILEVMLALVLLGVGLGGLGRLLGQALGAAGDQGRRMEARWEALAALESGRPGRADSPVRVQVRDRDGLREARADWPGRHGQLRLRVWHGRD